MCRLKLSLAVYSQTNCQACSRSKSAPGLFAGGVDRGRRLAASFLGRKVLGIAGWSGFPPGLLLFVALELLGQLWRLLGVQLHGFFRPLYSAVEVAGLGVAGGQGAEDVSLFIFGRVACFFGNFDGALSVAKRVVGRGRQDPGQVIEHAAIARVELERALIVGDGLGLLAQAQVSVGPATKCRGKLGIGFDGMIVGG